MEDTNRDYRNTINLLRMQSEESTIDKSNLKTYQPKCGCSNNSQEQTINKVDMMLNNFRQRSKNVAKNQEVMNIILIIRIWTILGTQTNIQMSDQHTGAQLINQQSRIPNQANPLFMTPMAPPHYSQIPTEQSRINPGHIQAPMYHNNRIQAIPTAQYRMTPQPIPQNIESTTKDIVNNRQTERNKVKETSIKEFYDQRTSMPVIAKQSHAEEIERQKQLQQLTNQDDNT
ncbi:Hypothetical predicted protein [Mytilus galloprovincialis]|uniref:Uncharacterized protein n=1 Tax=Mytilus galloprovincialis TaxID=29158 RepID=A0A8B6FE08_MYTGA|nr:Hypothetical predicted protein [Mytilus galloprovincialis]